MPVAHGTQLLLAQGPNRIGPYNKQIGSQQDPRSIGDTQHLQELSSAAFPKVLTTCEKQSLFSRMTEKYQAVAVLVFEGRAGC